MREVADKAQEIAGKVADPFDDGAEHVAHIGAIEVADARGRLGHGAAQAAAEAPALIAVAEEGEATR